MDKQQLLDKISDLVGRYESDDCINWGDDAIDTLCEILDAEGIAIPNPDLQPY